MKKAIPAMVMACLMLVTIFITISVNAAYDSVQQEVPLNAIKIEDNENPLNDGNTIYVDDNAPNDPGPNDPDVSDPFEDGTTEHPFDMIQEGIDAASDGDTVFVYSGIYYEHVDVEKSITLMGELEANTIIDGCKYRYVVRLATDDIKIAGFTIQNGSRGMEVTGSNNNIIGNTITSLSGDRVTGLLFLDDGYYNNVTGNTITSLSGESSAGIECWSVQYYLTVSGNVISNLYGERGTQGISCKYLLFGNIANNNISDFNYNKDSYARGIYIRFGEYFTIAENSINNLNGGGALGINSDECWHGTITGNTITNIEGDDFAFGIRPEYCDMTVTENTIKNIKSNSGAYGITIGPLFDDSNFLIADNTIEDIIATDLFSTAIGINAFGAYNIDIKDNNINKVSSSTERGGIHLLCCKYGNITGNTIKNTGSSSVGYGVFLMESTYFSIKNNIFKNNHKDASFEFSHSLKENESFTGKIPKSYDDIRDQKDLSNIWDGNSWDEQLPLKRKTITGKLEVYESGWPTGTVNLYNYDENPKVKSYSKNQLLTNTLFMRLLERFPNAFPLLRHLLGL